MNLLKRLKKETEKDTRSSCVEEIEKVKNQFLSGISHKVRTPLHAIMGYSEALLDENLNDSAKEKAQNILSSSVELLHVIDGMLDISKIENNEMQLENKLYHPLDVIRDMNSYLQKNVNEDNISISYEVKNQLPYTLYGDENRIREALVHLCNNAIKFTQIGFIKLSASSIESGNNCILKISIEDSGVGIKEENYEKIFSKFDRIGTKDEVNTEGIGLGLLMSKKIAELMNGDIKVESTYQKGSKFTITFEQKVAEKDEPIEILELDPVKFKDKKILLVDDNSLNLKVASLLLQKYEVSIDKVQSGKEAIQKIVDGCHYDLIFMDDMMPEMDGVETLQKLKMKPSFQVPTVALTANAVYGAREHYLKKGFQEYLAKPLNKKELEKVLMLFLKK